MTERPISRQGGFLLVTVVVVLAILATIALMLSTSTSLDNAVLFKQSENVRLDYVAEAGIQHALWQARQSDCSNYPSLVNETFGDHVYSVVVTPDSGSPVTFESTAVSNSGPNTTIQRSGASVYSTATMQTVVFQPGSEGEDAELWDQEPNRNYGDEKETWVSSASDDTTRSLLRFDLSTVPAHAIVLDATLSLERQSGSGSNQPVSAHRITSSWNENEVTWNSRDDLTGWEEVGGDFDSYAIATTAVGPGNGRYDWNITPLAQTWVDGRQPNFGVMLVAATAGAPGERFYTSDENDVSRQPSLSVSYVCECGQLCPSPTSSGKNVLFVVTNDSSPTNEELAHKTLIESWGHTVSLIDDDATQSEFNTAIANNDVAYATNDITASRLDAKLVNATIGVVTSEVNLSSAFGLSSSVAWDSGTTIEINNNSHYITSPFVTGPLTIFSGFESLAYAGGTLSPELGLLASSTSGFGVITLDAGAEMFSGGAAAGRRVQLPWGGSPSVDPTDFTTQGLTLLQRALEWGSGEGADTEAGLIAHWKLDDGAGVTALDSVGGHDGTVSEAIWTSGEVDGGLEFDGFDDRVVVPHADSLSLTDGMTLTAWIRTDSVAGGYKTVLSKDGVGNDSNYWLGTWRNEFTFGFWANGFFREVSATSANLQIDTWYHIAASFDNASNEVELYLNGAAVQSGTIAQSSTAITADVAIGSSPDGEYWDGDLDDVRIYDRVLSSSRIAKLAGASGGGGNSGYTEMYAPWLAANSDTWETVSLASFGVPPNAVVEVAVVNGSNGSQLWGGVRATGSGLNRRLQLHEAESGGNDFMVLHVQADGSSRIEHYSDLSSTVTFVLLGYWVGSSFVESWDSFNSPANGSWASISLGGFGVAPVSVTEVLMTNESQSVEKQAGVRKTGSSSSRLVDIHEAEGGGGDMVTLFVTTSSDASASIEGFATDSNVTFYNTGYWSVPPGTYTEAAFQTTADDNNAWGEKDLTTFGVPANAVVEMAVLNEETGREATLGARQNGSSEQRRLELQEAESGGGDLGRLHVNADGGSRIQLFDDDNGRAHQFYLLGWWDLNR